ncbi:MAG: hypothetical protein WD768_08350 [Phycisphaeraceae bacterium]
MIADTSALTEIRESWRGVEGLRDKLQRALLGSFAQGASFAIFAADAAHNLPFVHACAVLNDVLEQLKQEGHFQSKSIFLGALLSASRGKLAWKNLPLIDEAVARRNDVAHRAEVLPRADCWRFIDAIREELVSWSILQAS